MLKPFSAAASEEYKMLSQRLVRWLNGEKSDQCADGSRGSARAVLFSVFQKENRSSDQHDSPPPDSRMQLRQDRFPLRWRDEFEYSCKKDEPAHRQQNKADEVPDGFHFRGFSIHEIAPFTRKECSE
jgi:hypothetical protein